MNKKYLLAVACTFMFAACGDEVTEIHQEGMAVLEKGEKLSEQACDKTNVGEMLFVMDSSEAFICDGESWQTLKGEKGDKGEDGKDGIDGKDGADGKDGEKGDKGSKGNPGKAGADGVDGNDGQNGVDGKDGEKGDPGEPGAPGQNGEKGDKGEDGKDLIASPGTMGSFVDNRDGHVYKTIVIGTQTWMAENLNYSVNPGKRSWCGGGKSKTEGDCSVYGRLYTWAAAMDSVAAFGNDGKGCGYNVECETSGTMRGICPEGWHLPDTTEWETLFATVGGKNVAGKMLKSASGWSDYNGSKGNGLDTYGFSAIPAGFRGDEGKFFDTDDYASFWSATEDNSYYAYYMNLGFDSESANLYNSNKSSSSSVRCLRDK